MKDVIELSHGDGGINTSKLINNFFIKYFGNEILNKLEDSAILNLNGVNIAFTTDSFVVSPIFFPGGDIGKLSICGTINDLVTTGCKPIAISFAVIIEEGFPIEDLEKILTSINYVLKETNLKIVTGDTKVVNKGNADKIFINTTGIGILNEDINISPLNIKPGDKILINGSIGEHGLAILSSRKEFSFKSSLQSDCAPLSSLVNNMLGASKKIHALRDVTRGGLATILIELAKLSRTTMTIYEEKIPLKRETKGICEFLGLDPLYLANEGKMVAFVDRNDAEKVLAAMRKNKYGKDSQIIGEVNEKGEGLVIYQTKLNTRRVLDLQYSEQLPRIC
ncbi:MAG: hydrogenase expression/formation protein HypE [Actinobacteria bacterium]|nr:hydrogenase expression/formation protein HypE [Actinomycetota bacterium]